jgi:CO/xanthine dehydrogenase FAD-binding subunit
MSPFEYYRPSTMEEALSLLDRAVPLGGGTTLVPNRRKHSGFIDLQNLGLNGIKDEGDEIVAGATLTLQDIVDQGEAIFPKALVIACRQEAGRNIRNSATLAGRIISCDGRSPLATSLLALDAKAVLEPGKESIEIETLLAKRGDGSSPYIVCAFRIVKPKKSIYLQVGRAPTDLPIVCTAAAVLPVSGKEDRIQIAIGGYGERPVRIVVSCSPTRPDLYTSVISAGRDAYLKANDAWASGEYRSEVVSVLIQRVIKKVMEE